MKTWLRRAALVGLASASGCVAVGEARPTSTPPAAAAQPVEIHWDRHQVPHVRAEGREGVAYGLGWAQLRAYPEEVLMRAPGESRA